MIVLNILMILLGLSTLVYSFFEIRVWGGLYFERDYHCIERFRKQNKVTDLVSCIHNIAKCAFGLAVVIAGLKRWMPEENLGLAHAVLFVSFGLLVVDACWPWRGRQECGALSSFAVRYGINGTRRRSSVRTTTMK